MGDNGNLYSDHQKKNKKKLLLPNIETPMIRRFGVCELGTSDNTVNASNDVTSNELIQQLRTVSVV